MIRGIVISSLVASYVVSVIAHADNVVGVRGEVGCGENPKRVERLRITRPGVYENFLVDSNWAGGNRVKITADNVALRNCEIRSATGNGVGAFGRNATIEHCLFRDNEICLRLHGPTGRGDALVTVANGRNPSHEEAFATLESHVGYGSRPRWSPSDDVEFRIVDDPGSRVVFAVVLVADVEEDRVECAAAGVIGSV